MKRFTVLLAAVVCALPLGAQPFGASSPEFRVNTYTTAQVDSVDVAYAGTNGFVIAWSGHDPTASNIAILAQRFELGQPLGEAFRVNADVIYVQGSPRIGRAPSGNVSANQYVVAWVNREKGGGLRYNVYGRRYGSSGPLGDQFQVNTYTTGNETYPDVALAANGDFVVVWEQPDADGTGIFARRYASSGAAQGGVFRVNVVVTGAQENPAVARSSSGDFVVVWQSYQEFGTNHDIVGRRFSSTGAPLTDDFAIESSTSDDHFRPTVAPLGVDAAFVVAWTLSPGGANSQVFARRFDASGTPSAGSFHVNTVTTFLHSVPSVSGDSQGGFTVVWDTDSEDGQLGGVFARRYAPSGVPVGDEFRVNVYTTGSQDFPRVAMGGAGAFTVTWRGFGQYATSSALARTFCPLAGDADGNNALDVADVFYLINSLFAGGPAPVHASDANGDGNTDVADVFYLINALFAGGPAPVCVP
jgi:hypothetical protein